MSLEAARTGGLLSEFSVLVFTPASPTIPRRYLFACDVMLAAELLPELLARFVSVSLSVEIDASDEHLRESDVDALRRALLPVCVSSSKQAFKAVVRDTSIFTFLKRQSRFRRRLR